MLAVHQAKLMDISMLSAKTSLVLEVPRERKIKRFWTKKCIISKKQLLKNSSRNFWSRVRIHREALYKEARWKKVDCWTERADYHAVICTQGVCSNHNRITYPCKTFWIQLRKQIKTSYHQKRIVGHSTFALANFRREEIPAHACP